MNSDYITHELENEIKYLRERNAKLSSTITKQQEKIETLEEELAFARKKPGRKKYNAEWEQRYVQIKECIEKGMRPKDIMEELYISSPTFYRFRKVYLKEKSASKKQD